MQIKDPREVFKLQFQVPTGQWPTCVALVSPRRVAAGNRDGQILIWDLPDEGDAAKGDAAKDDAAKGDAAKQDKSAKGEAEGGVDAAPALLLTGHDNAITCLRALRDGRTLISASLDGTIRVWDLSAKPSGTAEIVLDYKSREALARRKRGEEAEAILDAPGLSLPTLGPSSVLQEHRGWIRALGVSQDETRMISGDDSCLSIVWDLKTREPLARWHGHPRVWVTSAALTPDGSTAFTAEFAGRRSSFDVPAAQARLWDAATGELKLDLLKLWTPKVKDEDRQDSYGYGRAWGDWIKRGLVSACFSADGKLLALAQGGETQKGEILVVDADSGKVLRKLAGHASGARDVRFSSDGQHLLSSGRDTILRVWQVADGKQVAELGAGRGGQFKDWFDGIDVQENQVAAADIAGYVRLWKLS